MPARDAVTRGQGDAVMVRTERVGDGAMADRDVRARNEGGELAFAASRVRRRLQAAFPDIAPAQIEDAVSEAVRQYLERERGEMSPGAMLVVLKKLAIWNLHHHLRAERWRSPTPPGGMEQVSDPKVSADVNVEREEVRQLSLEEHLVSRRSRTILALWSLGFRIREIAMRVHIKAANVRKKKERAIRKIREHLSEEHGRRGR